MRLAACLHGLACMQARSKLVAMETSSRAKEAEVGGQGAWEFQFLGFQVFRRVILW